MNVLYKDMNGRMKYLESLPDSEENKWRKEELILCIVAVQQRLLKEMDDKVNKIVSKRSQLNK